MILIDDIVIPLIEKYTQGVISTLNNVFKYAEIEKLDKNLYIRLMEDFDKQIDEISLLYVNKKDNENIKQPYKENIKRVYQNLVCSHMDII